MPTTALRSSCTMRRPSTDDPRATSGSDDVAVALVSSVPSSPLKTTSSLSVEAAPEGELSNARCSSFKDSSSTCRRSRSSADLPNVVTRSRKSSISDASSFRTCLRPRATWRLAAALRRTQPTTRPIIAASANQISPIVNVYGIE